MFNVMLISFALYFTVLVSIGLYFYFKAKTSSEFLLGDRSVNYFVTAIATQASDMGAWLFMAFPAAVYTSGVFEIWTIIGLIIGNFCNWQFIAPKLRQVTAEYNSMTLSSYFEKRYNDSSGALRLCTALASLIFFTVYIATGLMGIGKLFASSFGLTYNTGIVIGLVSAVVYTLLGGFIAIAWCDLFQGMLLLGAIVIVPTVAYFHSGGATTIIETAQTQTISLSLFDSCQQFFKGMLLSLGWGLGYFGMPHILVNFMGIDDVKNIRAAKYVGLIWQTIVLTSAACIGLVGIAYFTYPVAEPELLFVHMTKELFTPIIAGFILCGILAATLSTLDSHIFISGSILSVDLYKKFLHPDTQQKRIIFLSRLGSLITALFALGIAWTNNSSLYHLVNYAWAGLGSSFGPLVIMSLYSNHVTRNGALAGIVTGALVSGLWPYFDTTLLPLIPGFFSSLLAIVIVSKIR